MGIQPPSVSGTRPTTPSPSVARRTPSSPRRSRRSSTGHDLPQLRKKIDERKKQAEVAASLVEQFGQGRLLARIASRPGQTGRCDGYILEGKELDFYVRKLKAKKTK